MSSPVTGSDSLGNVYRSVSEMWKLEAGETGSATVVDHAKKREWYEKGIQYWKNVDPTVDGVLGGYGSVSDMDVAESSLFIENVCADMLASHSDNQSNELVALDCGAGVGRVSKNLLLKYFHQVDLVEPLDHFLAKAREDLAGAAHSSHRACNFFCTSLENFVPESGRYDVIWVQWCIGHLTDSDFVQFFERSKMGLRPGGIFVLKENICKSGFVVDKEDSSVTRSDALYRKLFNQSGLRIVKFRKQKNFPEELFQVHMYALSPDDAPTLKGRRSTSGYNTRQSQGKKSKNVPALII